MNGHLDKIPSSVKEWGVIFVSFAVGMFVSCQENFGYVFDLMDGFLSYFGIMSSVSFAIMAVLMQQFDRKCLELHSSSEIKDEAINVAKEMNVEIWRIVFMLLPVLAYFVMSFFNEHNRFGASLLASITFLAIAYSIILPFKYVGFMRFQIMSAVENKENDEITRDVESVDEILKNIDDAEEK